MPISSVLKRNDGAVMVLGVGVSSSGKARVRGSFSRARQLLVGRQPNVRHTRRSLGAALLTSAAVCLAFPALAQDATWLANPATGSFNTGTNWSTGAVPLDNAFFGTSTKTGISVSAVTVLGGFAFAAGAPAYTFTNSNLIDIIGAGFVFNGSSGGVTINNITSGPNQGRVYFENNSTAANITITNNGTGTSVVFIGNSDAGTATINNIVGSVTFSGTSTANHATITNNAGGTMQMNGSGSLGSATITSAGTMVFSDDSNAGSATITNTGQMRFSDRSTATNAIITNNAGGLIDVSGLTGAKQISAGSIDGGGRIYLGASELTVGSNGLNTTISGVISDCGTAPNCLATLLARPSTGGSFVKEGAGTLTLSAANTYTGETTVNGGTLNVTGSIVGSTMTVNDGGTLSGTGIVPFTLVGDGATLAPGPLGMGTGMLTINDRVMFCACSIYAVKVSGTGNDYANVLAGGLGGGDAFLGGLVRVTSPTSSYRFNSAYTILHTQGGLNATTFDSLVTPNGIGGALSYTSNNVLLTLTSQLGKVTGLNANQQRLATGLDAGFNTLGGSGGLGAIFAGNIAQNLTQASGEIATGTQQTTVNAMTQFMGMMTDPFSSGRGLDASGSSSFADESSASAYASTAKTRAARDAYAMFTKAPLAKVYDPRWSVWASGFGGSQTTDGNAVAGSNTATSRIGGVAVGADYRFSPNTIAGFALTGGGTSFSVANGGNGRSDLFQAGAFVRHTNGAAYVTAAVAYGWQDVTTNRTVIADQLQARFNTNAISGRIEGGYRVVMPWIGGLGLTPYAAAQFTSVALPSYAESAIVGGNAFALAYASRSVTATRSEFGFRSDRSFALNDAILTLRGRAAWAHDFNRDRSASATFQSLPGASFVVNGAAQASDSALVTAAAEIKWLNGFSLAGTFEGEFSDISRSYAGKGTVRYVW